jgi:putative peptidoglycan lipid II flippase
VAVVAGGMLQLAVQIPALRARGVGVRWSLDVRNPAFRRMLALMLPVVIGLAPVQINIAIDRLIAEAFVPGDGANSYLFYGNRLMQFPLALIGIAMGVAVFPGLSRLAASGRRGDLERELGRAYRATLFLALPATVGLAVLARPLISLIFEHGKFGAGSTDATAGVLLCYALGVFATCALQVVTRAFYALKDTRTPMLVTAGTVALNLGLNLALVFVLGAAGLALATSITAVVNLAILTRLARRRLAVLALRPVAASALRALAASLVCGAATWGALEGTRALLPGGDLGARLARVLLPMAAGAAAFLGAAFALRCAEARELLALFRRRPRV